MAYNLFTGWGYVVSSSLSNSGDLANALRAAPPAWHWRAMAAPVGVLFYAALHLDRGGADAPSHRLRVSGAALEISRAAPAPSAPAVIPRSLGWIVAAVLAAAIFVGAIGPGLRLQ